MKYLLLLPIIGLGLLHVVSWFGVLPPAFLSVSLSIACMALAIAGGVSAMRYAASGSGNKASLGEKILGSLNVRVFFLGLIFVGYFFFNFIYSASRGGNTKIEDGKYFALQEPNKYYYEISESEYIERQPHQMRARTGHPLVFGVVGFLLIRASRSSKKN